MQGPLWCVGRGCGVAGMEVLGDTAQRFEPSIIRDSGDGVNRAKICFIRLEPLQAYHGPKAALIRFPAMATPLLGNKLIAEAFGTFCLVFAGCGAMVVNEVTGGAIGHAGVALTWGLIVAAMIYAIGDVSGAHINPAVTVGFWLAKQFPGTRVLPYILAQVVGAFLASAMLRLLFPESQTLGATIPHDMGRVWQSSVLEVLLTLILMFVILCVAIGSKERGLMAGIAVGAVVGLEAMFAGPICGASMNPARSLAPAVVSMNAEALQSVLAYVLATVLGAALAVPLWHVIYAIGPED